MPIVYLQSICCIEPDENDKDEIFIKIKEHKIWPVKEKFIKIDVDEEVKIGLKFKHPGGKVELQLWEYDYIGKNECLGIFDLAINEPGSFTSILSKASDQASKADYTITWKVIRD